MIIGSSSLALFDVLKATTRDLEIGDEFALHPRDFNDLMGLKPAELVSRGFGDERAGEVCEDLFFGKCEGLGKSLGLRLKISREAERLAKA